MIYLLGGAPRTGKSSLTRELIRATTLVAVPTDAIHYAMTHAEPTLEWDSAQDIPDAAREFARAQYAIARNLHESEGGGILEGQTVLPEHARSLIEEGIPVAACFLGWSSVDVAAVVEFGGENDWFDDLDDDEQADAVEEILQFSEFVLDQARTHDLPYVDMAAGPYAQQRSHALATLLEPTP